METNASLFKKYVKKGMIYEKESDIFQHSLTKDQELNITDEWLKNSKNRYKLVKEAYEYKCTVRSMLCPRYVSDRKGDSMSYLITGSTDNKIRYWDLQKDIGPKRSYYINTPDDSECEYNAGYPGDVYVVQEKITGKKASSKVGNSIGFGQGNDLGRSLTGSMVGGMGSTMGTGAGLNSSQVGRASMID
jgi:WD40 repeat protein